MSFVAIDFETADRSFDSACAVALVKVENWQITERNYWLIRPPREKFRFTHIHGISWKNVADQPTFQELWPSIFGFIGNASFLAAHNADFDRSVLHACCRAAQIPSPSLRFRCTAKLARRVLKIYPTNLPAVCLRLGIPLDHHDARSDAEACARIMIAAHRRTHREPPIRVRTDRVVGMVQREFPGW
ncbi:MAG TPA: 3'-5' exonuclease [Gemmataceae bacterium]|jgi:DNA polymerase-3 subunit epsilon|nr:3'-5' exonuclease [Gemmataceae bacterium]